MKDLSDYPSTRKEAKRLGEMYYFNGKPCVNGGIYLRLTSTCNCRCDKCMSNHREYKKSRPKPKPTDQQKQRSRLYSKKYHAENRDQVLAKMRERNKAYYQANKEKIKAAARDYQKQNSEARNAYKRKWEANKLASDPNYKCAMVARRMLHRVLGVAGQKKTKKTQEILGYTFEQLRQHLERQFVKGMNWGNYGDWHIDHIIPVAEMIKSGIKDPAKINCLSNLKPVWAADNFAKGANVEVLI